MRTLITDPLIPEALWATLALVCFGALAGYLLVRPPGVSLARRIAFGCLLALGVARILAVLLNPTWQEVNPSEFGRPTLSVLIDTSGSMSTADCDGRSRVEEAVAVAKALRDDLDAQFEVRLWTFDKELRAAPAGDPDSLTARGAATDIAVSLSQALDLDVGEDSALVVLSDGIHNVAETTDEIRKAAQMARAMAVPIFTKSLGSDTTVEDLAVTVITPDDVAFVRQEVPIRLMVEHTGISDGTARVTVQADEASPASKVVRFRGDTPAFVEFPVSREVPGLYRYDVEVSTHPREIVRANNKKVFFLRVIDTPIRVLVLEGKPYWDFKFLLRELASDPGVSLTGGVRLKAGKVILRELMPVADEGKEDVPEEKVSILTDASSLLGSYSALKDYHVIVLGREADAFLTPKALENLCLWVSEWGGSVVCGRGRPTAMMPARLDAAMPVRWKGEREERFRLHLARGSASMGWLPADAPLMPSLATGARVNKVKTLATVVARAEAGGALDGMPVVSFQLYGAGKAVVIEGSGLWRWAFLDIGDEHLGDIYRRFWNNLLRWLAASAEFLPGQDAALYSSRTTYTTLDRAVIRLVVRTPDPTDESTPVIEIRESETNKEMHALSAVSIDESRRVFRASAPPLPAGSYVARVKGGAEDSVVACGFQVREPIMERLDLRARVNVMRRLAEDSGGLALSDDPADQIKESYMAFWRERHPDDFQRTPAWDRSLILLILAFFLAAAWVIRRRGGLV